MKIIKPNTNGINKTVKEILNGKIVFVPTDTVYGIAANPFNNNAVKKIYLLKKRSLKNSLILLCSNLKMAKKYAIFNKIAIKLTKLFWPGPLTLILKKKSNLKISKKWISKNNSIGVRIPNNEILLKIIKKCKIPIFCTSANISGEKNINSIKNIKKKFKNNNLILIEDDKIIFKKESTIIDVTNNNINILRKGILKKKELSKIIN
tara:strand:- start:481 stop:1098 length:618 start_codon:yes stop_codon:yes gene_type:complete